MLIPTNNKNIAITETILAVTFLSAMFVFAIALSYEYFTTWYYYFAAYLLLAGFSSYRYLKNRWIVKAEIGPKGITVFYPDREIQIPFSELDSINWAFDRTIDLKGSFSKVYFIRFKGFYPFGDMLKTRYKEVSDFNDFVKSSPLYIQVLEKQLDYHRENEVQTRD